MKRISAATLRVIVLGAGLGLGACSGGEESRSMEVVATAYTLAEGETKQGNVGLAAWGDRLEPGMKAIAVSRDLIDRGLSNGTRVRIEGLDGNYIVRDKMNKRWTKKIDIFMGYDRRRAREWGRQTVNIRWN